LTFAISSLEYIFSFPSYRVFSFLILLYPHMDADLGLFLCCHDNDKKIPIKGKDRLIFDIRKLTL